jgi:hypothetical protein
MTRQRLLILSKRGEEYRQILEDARLPDLDVAAVGSRASLPPAATTCNIVLGDPSYVREVLPRLAALEWVQATWAGVEPLLDPALRRDYRLTNIRGVFGRLMAEYVFTYLLAHERRLVARLDAQREGRWHAALPGQLSGRTIGLLGVGSIGAEVARTAKHFRMRVHGLTRSSTGCVDVDRYFHPPDRLAFALELDYLVNLMPNTAETAGLVDRDLLAALPAGAVFVNGGRGSAVDEAALVAALASDRLALAVLDVFNDEPLPADHVFWRTPNLLITSHTAAPSFPADIAAVFIDNYRRWHRGEPLLHSVDFERQY